MTHAPDDLTVLDAHGRVVPFASLFADRPMVIAFLRHFGWLFCREQAAQLSGIESELNALGVGLAFMGLGSPEQARAFAADYGVTAPIYVDPGRRVYRAMDFAHGVGATFNWSAVSHGVRAFALGHRQGAVQGDPWQQGGVVLVRPDGSMPYTFRSGAAGDHPAPADVLAAARRATA